MFTINYTTCIVSYNTSNACILYYLLEDKREWGKANQEEKNSVIAEHLSLLHQQSLTKKDGGS